MSLPNRELGASGLEVSALSEASATTLRRALALQLSIEDLAEIGRATAAVDIVGARYPEESERMTNR